MRRGLEQTTQTMNNKQWNVVFLCLGITILFAFQACEKTAVTPQVDTTLPPTGEFANVDAELWTYFQRFEDEALARGIEVDLNDFDITANIEMLDGDNVAGQCSYHPINPNHITIDEDFWEIASDLLKEMIVFHELGHCYLFRDHREDAYTTGRCVSIMRSGLSNCRDGYNTNTRATYLDELFHPESIEL